MSGHTPWRDIKHKRGSVAPSEWDKEREWVPLWLSALVLAPLLALGMVTLYWVFGEYLTLVLRAMR